MSPLFCQLRFEIVLRIANRTRIWNKDPVTARILEKAAFFTDSFFHVFIIVQLHQILCGQHLQKLLFGQYLDAELLCFCQLAAGLFPAD